MHVFFVQLSLTPFMHINAAWKVKKREKLFPQLKLIPAYLYALFMTG